MHLQTYICTHTNKTICSTYISTENKITQNRTQTQKQTICTQHAHNMHTHKQNNMQHIEQDNTEQHTEQHTDTTQPQHTCSAHNYRTYSLDYYFEYAYIKNRNTIELYTILKENI